MPENSGAQKQPFSTEQKKGIAYGYGWMALLAALAVAGMAYASAVPPIGCAVVLIAIFSLYYRTNIDGMQKSLRAPIEEKMKAADEPADMEKGFTVVGEIMGLFSVGAQGAKRGYGLVLFFIGFLGLSLSGSLLLIVLGTTGAMASTFFMERPKGIQRYKTIGRALDGKSKDPESLSKIRKPLYALMTVFCLFAVFCGEGSMALVSALKLFEETLHLQHFAFLSHYKLGFVILAGAAGIGVLITLLLGVYKLSARYPIVTTIRNGVLGAAVLGVLGYLGYTEAPHYLNAIAMPVYHWLAAQPLGVSVTLLTLAGYLLLMQLPRLLWDPQTRHAGLVAALAIALTLIMSLAMLNPIGQGSFVWVFALFFTASLAMNEFGLFMGKFENTVNMLMTDVEGEKFSTHFWLSFYDENDEFSPHRTAITLITAAITIGLGAAYLSIGHHFLSDIFGIPAFAWVGAGAYTLLLMNLFFGLIKSTTVEPIFKALSSIKTAKSNTAYLITAPLTIVAITVMMVTLTLDALILFVTTVLRAFSLASDTLKKTGQPLDDSYLPCTTLILKPYGQRMYDFRDWLGFESEENAPLVVAKDDLASIDLSNRTNAADPVGLDTLPTPPT